MSTVGTTYSVLAYTTLTDDENETEESSDISSESFDIVHPKLVSIDNNNNKTYEKSIRSSVSSNFMVM